MIAMATSPGRASAATADIVTVEASLTVDQRVVLFNAWLRDTKPLRAQLQWTLAWHCRRHELPNTNFSCFRHVAGLKGKDFRASQMSKGDLREVAQVYVHRRPAIPLGHRAANEQCVTAWEAAPPSLTAVRPLEMLLRRRRRGQKKRMQYPLGQHRLGQHPLGQLLGSTGWGGTGWEQGGIC